MISPRIPTHACPLSEHIDLVPAALVGDTGIDNIACCTYFGSTVKKPARMVTLNTCIVSNTQIDLMLETHQIHNGAFSSRASIQTQHESFVMSLLEGSS